MTEVRFYHLQNQSQNQVLPVILSKALERGHRILVKMPSEKHVAEMNDFLWSYHPDSFLPHGIASDDHADKQPILLTAEDDNMNDADVLIVAQGAESEMHQDFKLCCEMLDGHDESAVAAARERWKLYRDKKFKVTYWQQNGSGGWEEKS